jgi:hypothetical protein
MPREYLRLRFHNLRELSFQGCGDLAMQLLAPAAQESAVRSILHQYMLKGVFGVGVRFRAGRSIRRGRGVTAHCTTRSLQAGTSHVSGSVRPRTVDQYFGRESVRGINWQRRPS